MLKNVTAITEEASESLLFIIITTLLLNTINYMPIPLPINLLTGFTKVSLGTELNYSLTVTNRYVYR